MHVYSYTYIVSYVFYNTHTHREKEREKKRESSQIASILNSFTNIVLENHLWRYTPIIIALKTLRQEDQEFKAMFG